MKFNPKIHHRRSIRLQGYDYSRAGAYFVTICTRNRECLFGKIIDGQMVLNDAGQMVQTVWDEIPTHYPGIDIDKFIIMPNHIHGIVVVVGAAPRGRPEQGKPRDDGQPRGVTPTGLSLPDVVHRLKTMTTKRYVDGVKHNGWRPFPGKLWQRNYWEHVVRNESELNRIREYIRHNPNQWQSDQLHPGNPIGQPRIVGAGPSACPKQGQPRDDGQLQDNGQPQGVGQPQRVAPTGIHETSAMYEHGVSRPNDNDGETWMV